MKLTNHLPSFMGKHAHTILEQLEKSYLNGKIVSTTVTNSIKDSAGIHKSLEIEVPDDISVVDAFEIGMFIGQCEILAQTGHLR